MKPSKISYSESKESVNEIGLKSWRKAGVEIELDGGGCDDINHAFGEAKRIVGDALAVNNLKSNWGSDGWTAPEQKVEILSGGLPFVQSIQVINKEKERIEIAIDNAENLQDLEWLSDAVVKHGLVPQYLEKKKNLK